MRRGFRAWLLFALACLLPGWRLRERLAVEIQFRFDRPPLTLGWQRILPTWLLTRLWTIEDGDLKKPPFGSRVLPRRLGQAGEDALRESLAQGDSARRMDAAGLLRLYRDPPATRALVAALQDPDPAIAERAFFSLAPDCWFHQVPDREFGTDYSDEQVLAYIHRPGTRFVDSEVGDVLQGRGLAGLSLFSIFLSGREGKSLADAAADTMRWHMDRMPRPAWKVRTSDEGMALLNAIAAGFANPDPEVRKTCARSYASHAYCGPFPPLDPLLLTWDRSIVGIPSRADCHPVEDAATALLLKDEQPNSARCVLEMMDDRLPKEARMRVLRAGLGNPNAEIRRLCADTLAEEEAEHGDR